MQYVGYIVPDHPFDPQTVKDIRDKFAAFASEMQMRHATCPIATEPADPNNKLDYGPVALPVYNSDLEGHYQGETVSFIRKQFKEFTEMMLQAYFSGAPDSFRPDLVESGYLGHAMRCIEDARNALVEACAYRHSRIDPIGWIFATQVGIELRKAKDAFAVAATRRKYQTSK